MPLPTEKTPARNTIQDLTALIYGSPKIGKSTFCANADHALFLATEPGLNHLDVFQVYIDTWEKLLTTCGELASGKHQFKTAVIDTIDIAYKLCTDFVSKRENIAHPSDMEFGKGFAFVGNEFQRVLTKMAMLPMGLWLTSHATTKEMKTRTGKINKTIPTLPPSARNIVLGMADVILYADMEEVSNPDGNGVTESRIIHTRPSANYEAGDRTGRLPESLPLDYAAFVAAFEEGATKTTTKTA